MQQKRSMVLGGTEMTTNGRTENEITDRIATLEKRLINYPKDEYSTLHLMTEIGIRIEKDELKDVQLINTFSGRTQKAVQIMKKIYDDWMDEKHPDDKDVQKVKALLNRERTDLELKMKALHTKLEKVDGLERSTEYDHASGWWGNVERLFGDDI